MWIISLKRHCGDLAELTREELIDWNRVVIKLENSLRKSFNPKIFNWSCLMNHSQSQKYDPHIHWHMIPRYEKPIKVLSMIFEDNEFGHNYILEKKRVSKEIEKHIIKTIKNNL